MDDEQKLEKAYQALLAKDNRFSQYPREEVIGELKKRLEKKRAAKAPPAPEPKPTSGRRSASGINESQIKAAEAQRDLDKDFVFEDGEWKNRTGLEASVVGGVQGLLGGAMPTLEALKSISPVGRLERLAHEVTGSDMSSPFIPGEIKDTGRGLFEDIKATYLSERDKLIALDRQMQEEPEYHIFNTVGAVAPMLIPGGAGVGAARGAAAPVANATVRGMATQGAVLGGATGAAQGALSSENATEGEFMSLADMAVDAGIGGLAGTVLGGGLGYLGAKAGLQSREGPFKKRGFDVVEPEKPNLPLSNAEEVKVPRIAKGAASVFGGPKARLAVEAAEIAANAMSGAGKPIKMPKDRHPIIPRSEEGIMKATPDQITNYNTGQKLEVPELPPIARESMVPDDTSTMKIDLDATGHYSPEDLARVSELARIAKMEQVNAQVDEMAKGIGNKRDSTLNNVWQEARDRSPPPIRSGPGSYQEPSFKLDPLDDSFDSNPLPPNVRRAMQGEDINSNDFKRSSNPEGGTGADRPSAKKKSGGPAKQPEESLTEKENPEIKKYLNLQQFQNEFRDRAKGMGDDTMRRSFNEEELARNAEYGKEIGTIGKKLVDEFGGDEIAAAKLILEGGYAKSIDDLVKLLGIKGQGATAKAEQIAGDLGYKLPKYAEGSHKARRQNKKKK